MTSKQLTLIPSSPVWFESEQFQRNNPEAFPLWVELQRFKSQGHKPKNLERQLIKATKGWLPYDLFWQGGVCLAKAPYGDYIWHYAVEMEQERQWQYPEFVSGYVFGLYPETPFRGANPYAEPSRHRSWDCGYILGLHERSLQEGDRTVVLKDSPKDSADAFVKRANELDGKWELARVEWELFQQQLQRDYSRMYKALLRHAPQVCMDVIRELEGKDFPYESYPTGVKKWVEGLQQRSVELDEMIEWNAALGKHLEALMKYVEELTLRPDCPRIFRKQVRAKIEAIEQGL